MPGILGLIAKDRNSALFNQMIKTVNHFDYRIDKFVENGTHLGRVHLGYVNNSPQPIISKDKRYAIMMIGEIFSYKNTETDQIGNEAEFFLERWMADGLAGLSQMNGQYAVAIYDFIEKKLILISDRFGTKPVYYTCYDDKFLFAPEVKALILGDFKKEPDWIAVADLFHFGHLFGYKTLFRNVYQLPEASCLTFWDGKVEIKRYWDYPYHEEVYLKRTFTKSQVESFCEEMKARLLTAMKRQIAKMSNEILISLSGGLDSRYVAALAHLLKVSPIVAFTMGEPDSEDVIYAKMVAQELSIQHQCFQIQPFDVWRDARFFTRLSDGMSMINGPIQGFTPLRYYSGKQKMTLSSQMCDAVMGSTLYRKRIKVIMNKAVFDDESRHIVLNIFNLFEENQIESVFLKSVYDSIKDLHWTVPLEYVQLNLHPLHVYFLLLMNEHGRRGTLGGNLMNNLFFETRMPSYDYDLVDFTFRIPIELRKNQFLYRRAFSQMFPKLAQIPRQGTNLPINSSNFRFQAKSLENRIVGRLKPTPMNKLVRKIKRWNKPNYVSYKEWFCNELKQDVENIILDKHTLTRGIFDESGIRTLLNEHYTTEKDNSRLIWQIINLEYFLRKFID